MLQSYLLSCFCPCHTQSIPHKIGEQRRHCVMCTKTELTFRLKEQDGITHSINCASCGCEDYDLVKCNSCQSNICRHCFSRHRIMDKAEYYLQRSAIISPGIIRCFSCGGTHAKLDYLSKFGKCIVCRGDETL